MHSQDSHEARREERRRRREEWRRHWEAKREEWRRRHERHREEWRSAFGGPGAWGFPGESAKVAELEKTVADMKGVIAALSERVLVLEKLAVDPDKRLAEEIEKLRDKP